MPFGHLSWLTIRGSWTVNTWEYSIKIVPSENSDAAERLLNMFGQEGWELVAVETGAGEGESQTRFFFKRPAPKPSKDGKKDEEPAMPMRF